MPGESELLWTIRLATDLLDKDLDEAFSGAEGKADKSAENVEKSWGKRLSGLGSTLTKTLTPAALAVGAAGAKMFASYHDGFELLRSQSGRTGQAFEELEASAKRVAGRVSVPFEETAAVIAEIAQRTELTGEPLERLTQQIVELSEITGTDASDNVETFVKLLTSWKVATEDQAGALDLLNNAAIATGNSVTDIAANTLDARTTMEGLGFTFEDTIALTAQLGGGFDKVFPGLRTGLANLSKTTNDVPAAFEQVVTSIENAGSAAEGNRKAIEVFGSRAGPQLAAAIREGRFSVEEFTAELEASDETVHKIHEDTETFGDKMAEVWNKVVVAVGPIGEQLAIIATILSGVGPVVKGVGAIWEWNTARVAANTLAVEQNAAVTVAGAEASTVAVEGLGAAWATVAKVAAPLLIAIAVINKFRGGLSSRQEIAESNFTGNAPEEIDKWITGVEHAIDLMGIMGKEATELGNTVQGVFEDAAFAAINFTGKVTKGKRVVGEFAGMSRKEFVEFAADTRSNFSDAGGAFDALADKTKVTAQIIIRQLNRTINAQLNFQRNWTRVVKRAGDDGEDFVAWLQENYGDEAPRVIAALANANQRQFARIVAQWQRSQGIADQTAGAIGGAFETVQNEIRNTVSEVDRLIFSLNSIPTNITVGITAVASGVGHFFEGRQHGGPVLAGHTYIVGEGGPEFLTMGSGSSGTVHHNARMAGGQNVNNYIDLRGSDLDPLMVRAMVDEGVGTAMERVMNG